MEGQKKFVIGLTGNIATGKSTVRQMLASLGAFTIDTDALGHRVLQSNGAGYHAVLHLFGTGILDPDGEINRGRLAAIVFRHPAELKKLEAVVHPLVISAVNDLIAGAGQQVVVLESYPLFESGMNKLCDQVWMVTSDRGLQVERLIATRGLTRAEAEMRIDSQAHQSAKLDAADVILHNRSSQADLLLEIRQHWQSMLSKTRMVEPVAFHTSVPPCTFCVAELTDRQAISGFLQSIGQPLPGNLDEMYWLKTGHLLLETGSGLSGVIEYTYENLLFSVLAIHLPCTNKETLPQGLSAAVIQLAVSLNAEGLIVSTSTLACENQWMLAGLSPVSPENLAVHSWRNSAIKLLQGHRKLFYKQLCAGLHLITSNVEEKG